jgi:hypothetical protein
MNSSPATMRDDTPQPARQVVASCAGYRDAAEAVDYLAGNRFPVEHAAIVGRELELVQQVTGRLTALDAAARSALTGGPDRRADRLALRDLHVVRSEAARRRCSASRCPRA